MSLRCFIGRIVVKKVRGIMNIRLNSHSEQILRDQLARGQFSSPEEVIERALEALSETEQRRPNISLAEFETTLDALAERPANLPVLPPDATSPPRICRN